MIIRFNNLKQLRYLLKDKWSKKIKQLERTPSPTNLLPSLMTWMPLMELVPMLSPPPPWPQPSDRSFSHV